MFMGYPMLLTSRFDKFIKFPYNVLDKIYSLNPKLKKYMVGGGSYGIETLFEKASHNFIRDLLRED